MAFTLSHLYEVSYLWKWKRLSRFVLSIWLNSVDFIQFLCVVESYGPTNLIFNLTSPRWRLLPKRFQDTDGQVTNWEANAFAQENDLQFIETSALTGDNVDEAFQQCVRTILEKIKCGDLDPDRLCYGRQRGVLGGLSAGAQPLPLPTVTSTTETYHNDCTCWPFFVARISKNSPVCEHLVSFLCIPLCFIHSVNNSVPLSLSLWIMFFLLFLILLVSF